MPITYENPAGVTSSETALKSHFLDDVLKGLKSIPKKLDAKYFYDETGDLLFQKIMSCKEYYITRCEAEIFDTYASEIALALKNGFAEFDLIELGAGDASKTIYLLRELTNTDTRFCYVPIDISGSIIQYLEKNLRYELPELQVAGLNGEYLEMLEKVGQFSERKKAVLFLGGNIGNMDTAETIVFLKQLRAKLNKGDRVLIGFDLKKNPEIILAAYNDSLGFTRAFNLNLLERINRELGADFDINTFTHYPTYDPVSGSCKSYLVSKQAQHISIANETISFKEGEPVYMELSQKYDLPQIWSMATSAGFRQLSLFSDSKNWFVDAVWECV